MLKLSLQSETALYVDEFNDLNDGTQYRQLIGLLLNLYNTVRPDISYAAGYLSRFVWCPT